MERLEEEKLALRKQLLAQRHTSSELTGREGGRASRAAGGKREEEREETDDALGDDPRMVIEQLRTQVHRYAPQCKTQQIETEYFIARPMLQ